MSISSLAHAAGYFLNGLLSQQAADDLAIDICQPEVATLEAIRQSLMVEAEQMQQRGLQVVDVNRVARDVPSQLVGFADHMAPLYAAPCQPQAVRGNRSKGSGLFD